MTVSTAVEHPQPAAVLTEETQVPVVIDPRRHDAVVFDMDAIVGDVQSLHRAAWTATFDSFANARDAGPTEDRTPFDQADYSSHLHGRSPLDGSRALLAARRIALPDGQPGDQGDDSAWGLANRAHRLFGQMLVHGPEAFTAKVAMVRRLRDVGIKTAVCSASRNCGALLEAAGIAGLFEAQIDGLVAEQLGLPAKPDPAVLLTAAHLLDVRPDRCVVVDDSPAGIAAGRNGGFALVIGVADAGIAADLTAAGADTVIVDLFDITVRADERPMSSLPDALGSYCLLSAVLESRHPAFFLDFDGTLSDIVDDPAAATPAAGAAEALRALSATAPVTIVSGRDLADIRARVDVPGIWYAGSHGFELCAPDGTHHQHEAAAAAVAPLAGAAETLRTELADVAGVLVEHKRFAVAVHYRNVAEDRVNHVAATVHALGRRSGLRVTRGRKVTELRPDLDWDKGTSLNWILDRIDGPQRLLPVYIGDDLTDEDAFDAVQHTGIGVMVRHTEDGDRPTAAHFALNCPDQTVQLLAQLATTLAAAAGDDGDAWSLVFDGYRPEQERLREVLCAIGNGYLVSRSAAPEVHADAVHYPGTYVAGLYNRLTDEVSGVDIDNESMVNVPNWLPLTFRIDGGPWFDIDTAELLSFRQTMELRTAECRREFRFRDSSGRTTKVAQRRIASMHDPHVCALQVTVTPEDWSGDIEFRSTIDGGVSNSGVERYRSLSGRHLSPPRATELSNGSTLMSVSTVQSHIPIAVAARTTVWRGERLIAADLHYVDDGQHAGHTFDVAASAGQPVTVEKVAVIHTGRDHAVSEPDDAAQRRLAALPGYRELLADHRVAWSQLWESFTLRLTDDTDHLLIVRLHILHTLQSVSQHTADLDAGVPARGLHGEAYRGHVFWDELFVIPVLNLRMPEVSRSLLRYRYRRLNAARRAATAAGYAGAMYPWQSGSDGREESQRMHLNPNSGHWHPDASARAHHVGIAIAYNIWQYFQVTGDIEYLIDEGAEMLVEIARFWVSRASFDADRDRYVIRGVIGPDEFHSGYPGRPYDGVDNNAYTNVMAVWVIVRALDALERLPLRDRVDLLETLGVDGRELARWDTVSRRMYVPFHDGVISQFEGYWQLPELDWERYRREYGNIRRLDRILEAENDSVNNYRASKQADALMLFYLLSADELRELLSRLGYRFAPEQIPRTVDYYLERTSHGSTLSALVDAWVLTRRDREQAMAYFDQVLQSDVADVQGGTTEEGIHLAAMAGSVDLLQRCFSGLETRGDRLVLGPMWPEDAGILGLSLWYRGHRLHLRISGRAAEVTADPTGARPIEVECRGHIQRLESGATIHIR